MDYGAGGLSRDCLAAKLYHGDAACAHQPCA